MSTGISTTLTDAETLAAPLTLLAKGECQTAAGQYREGSATVYQADFAALQVVAAQRGWVCETDEDAGSIIYRLDGVSDPEEFATEAIARARAGGSDSPLPVYLLLFTTVTCFKIHGATVFQDGISLPVTFWGPEDYVKSLPLVRKFIDLLQLELSAEA